MDFVEGAVEQCGDSYVFQGSESVSRAMAGRVVDANPPCPRHCSILGAVPLIQYCGAEGSLTVQTRSAMGVPLRTGGASVIARISCVNYITTPPAKEKKESRLMAVLHRTIQGKKEAPTSPFIQFEQSDLMVHDCRDGTYSIDIHVSRSGVYDVEVLVGGEPIAGDPIRVLVRPLPNFTVRGRWKNACFTPRGVCYAGGVVYVSDKKGCCVHLFRYSDGSFIKSFGASKQSTENGEFDTPLGLCCHDDMLFVADWGNHRVQVLNRLDGSFLFAITAQHIRPTHVCYHDECIYFSDATSQSVGVSRLSDGAFLRTIGAGRFKNPTGLCCHDGLLYVSDTCNKCIKVMRCSDGSFVKEFGRELGISPVSICYHEGLIYVADSKGHCLHIFNKNGVLVAVGRSEVHELRAIGFADDGDLFVINADTLERWTQESWS
jgi:hypothetical protein